MMFNTSIKRIVLLVMGASIAIVSGVVANHKILTKGFKPTGKSVAQSLDWQPNADSQRSLCNGAYYFDPAITSVKKPPKMNQASTTITAKGKNILMPDGWSILNKDVVFLQKGRKITADKAYVYRNNHTGTITHIKLFGHVHDLTADNLIVAPYAYVDMVKHKVFFKHAMVRHRYPSQLDGIQTSWGTATKVHKLANGNVVMQHKLQLSLCSPLHPSWIIHGAEGVFNKKAQKLRVQKAYITFHHIPIFYTPVFAISTDKTRKSGFLMPKVSYSSDNGFQFLVPYYFNLAPNYDDLFKNGWFTKRGYFFKNRFRWLTKNSKGIINFYGLLHDSEFGRFRNKSLNDWSGNHDLYPYYNALLKSGLRRYSFNAKANFQLTKHWQAALQLHHVSDDYFLQNFSNFADDGMIEPDQLLNSGSLSYLGHYQQFSLDALGYQTLHPYGLGGENQYTEFGVTHAIGFPYKRLNFQLQTDVTNFVMPNNLFSTAQSAIDRIVNGTRMHTRASVVIPWMTGAGFVRAKLAMDMLANRLFYEKPVTAPTGVMAGVMPKQVSRILPIVNIDSGLYLINPHIFHQKNWGATIKPELSYLYIPYRDQQTLPNFDTTLLPLSYDTLFSTNRFLGIDRIQNANQFNLGIRTTITNNNTGFQFLSIGSGMQYYMALPKVQLSYQQPSAISQNRMSPWVNEITLTPASVLSTTLDWNWNWYKHATDSATIETSYIPNDRIRLMGSFDYLAKTTDNPTPTYLYTLGLATPIGHHLETFSYQYYDAQAGRMLASVAGFQYDGCCWALRTAISHRWDHQDPNNSANQIYNNAVYVEFILKGLGNFGSSLESLLNSDFSGYNYR